MFLFLKIDDDLEHKKFRLPPPMGGGGNDKVVTDVKTGRRAFQRSNVCSKVNGYCRETVSDSCRRYNDTSFCDDFSFRSVLLNEFHSFAIPTFHAQL